MIVSTGGESAWWEMSENGKSTQTKGAKKDGK